ncbi:hypothetical protein F5148DRAFT_1374783 [Russula earlei]|uniref:Uncharacterized protein n=1 Tax=Russula earlei TaxID=71964 RepID=A0ACC0UE31_9AGAM|nr:hypothetical protein F5148DRAFT_1374783 [Russula earlei]
MSISPSIPTPSPSSTSFRHVSTENRSRFMSKQLAEKCKIVDKSSAIRDFLRNDYPVHVLLRPRRSGKSTLLLMFQAFFERDNPAAIKERKDLFLNNDLAITRHPVFDEEFGKYPVLYVDLSNVIGTTFENLEKEFRLLVKRIVFDLKRRGILSNLDELDEVDRSFLDQILNEEHKANIEAEALFRLTEVLHTLHKREVVVLVDEYDTPTSYAIRHGYSTEANVFFRNVFSSLLKVGVFTSYEPTTHPEVAKAGWLSGFNNLTVFTLGAPGRYSTACMFTEAETQLLFEKQKEILQSGGLDISFTFADLRKWYNGYNSGDGVRLYNPWSIARAFEANELGCYRNESGYDQIALKRIRQMLKSDEKFRRQFEALIMDEPAIISLDHGMTYSSLPEMSMEQLWTLLYSAGYLTTRMVDEIRDASSDVDMTDSANNSDDDDTEASHNEDINSSEHSDGGEDRNIGDSISGDFKATISAQIPNSEIRSLFRQWLVDHLTRRVKHSRKKSISCADIFQDMVSGSMASFSKGFSKFVWHNMPTQFLGSKEYLYQAYVASFFTVGSTLRSSSDLGLWSVKVEECAGMGRLDLMFSRQNEAVIQEHKRIGLSAKDKKSGYGESQRERLSKAAENALEQIKAKGYRARLPDQVTKLREYGIAFLGPYCAIVSDALKREPGGQWKVTKSYITERNEQHRVTLYTAST